jgi:hypothetical protein
VANRAGGGGECRPRGSSCRSSSWTTSSRSPTACSTTWSIRCWAPYASWPRPWRSTAADSSPRRRPRRSARRHARSWASSASRTPRWTDSWPKA